jgi:hypothetical protein
VLFPLLIAAHRDIDVQAWLRGTLGEISAHDTAALMTPRDYARRGVFKHVVLPAKLERRFASDPSAVSATSSGVAFPKAALVRLVRDLRTLLESLARPASSTWSDYQHTLTYSADETRAKSTFVRAALGSRRLRVVDLGCNTGEYSRLALECGSTAVSVDLDSRSIDACYRAAPETPDLSLVVASLLNPTPAMGWALEERRSLPQRVRGDLFLALALVHHLRISGGVPLSAIVSQLFTFAPEGVVEWVDKRDDMVARMLALRPDVYPDYRWETFVAEIERHATILTTAESHGGRRRLCHVRRRHGRTEERQG